MLAVRNNVGLTSHQQLSSKEIKAGDNFHFQITYDFFGDSIQVGPREKVP